MLEAVLIGLLYYVAQTLSKHDCILEPNWDLPIRPHAGCSTSMAEKSISWILSFPTIFCLRQRENRSPERMLPRADLLQATVRFDDSKLSLSFAAC